MLRLGDRLILSDSDARRWARITGQYPDAVRTMADLDAYVLRCKQLHAGASSDAAFVRWLMDVELERYGGEPAADRPGGLELVQIQSERDKLARELVWNIALGRDIKARTELSAQMGALERKE